MIRPVFKIVPSRPFHPHGGRHGALASPPVVPPPPVGTGQTLADAPHAGSPDLTRWPMSLAERSLAGDVIAGVDRYVELLEVTGSSSRALAVLFLARGECAGSRA